MILMDSFSMVYFFAIAKMMAQRRAILGKFD